MTTDELIEILKMHPGLPVMLDGPDTIVYATKAETDCFDTDEGWVVVIEGDWEAP